jgi:hypothetical protein
MAQSARIEPLSNLTNCAVLSLYGAISANRNAFKLRHIVIMAQSAQIESLSNFINRAMLSLWRNQRRSSCAILSLWRNHRRSNCAILSLWRNQRKSKRFQILLTAPYCHYGAISANRFQIVPTAPYCHYGAISTNRNALKALQLPEDSFERHVQKHLRQKLSRTIILKDPTLYTIPNDISK